MFCQYFALSIILAAKQDRSQYRVVFFAIENQSDENVTNFTCAYDKRLRVV
jgi:hypothetical protein